MLKTPCFLYIFLLAVQLSGQEPPPVDQVGQRGGIEDFAYPTFLNGEVHANFLVGYQMDPKFLAQLQGFYDTYILKDVFQVPLTAKWYVSDGLYLYSGVQMEMEREKYGRETTKPRFQVVNGVGYEVDANFTLEAKHDLQFNKGNLGTYGSPNMFSLSGKYKF